MCGMSLWKLLTGSVVLILMTQFGLVVCCDLVVVVSLLICVNVTFKLVGHVWLL